MTDEICEQMLIRISEMMMRISEMMTKMSEILEDFHLESDEND